MRLAWITDCHLDRAAPAAVEGLLATLRDVTANAVIITGDVSHAGRLVADLQRLADAARPPIWLVLGNHDHYGASIGTIRDAVVALGEQRRDLRWLPPAGVVELAPGHLLVGVDGWADGRHGDPLHTPLVLNDDRLIAELADQDSRAGKLAVKRVLADADAARLDTLLARAAAREPQRVLVATHVPPFVEALKPGSREAHRHWHPLLVCGATGAVLDRFARAHPTIEVTVLSGHSHRGHVASILPNLTVHVGEARYGSPRVETIDERR
jgi:predicted phosphohydrolase